ncbi:MAG: ShlB/FhaC/HecB family hemolysin secretion/activation protein [Verrucomicrobiota bacterium]
MKQFVLVFTLLALFISMSFGISPVQESQLLPRSFIQEGILSPAGEGAGVPSAIRVEEDPGALLVRLSGILITDDSSKLRPKGLPLPEKMEDRIYIDLTLGYADTGAEPISSDTKQARIREAVEQSGIIGQRVDTQTLTRLAKVIVEVTGGMVVFPDQDATSGVVQALVLSTGTTAMAPVIGAITVTDTGEGSKVVAEPLRGIYLASDMQEAGAGKLPTGVHQSATISLPKETIESLQRHIGKTATLATLRKISREIIGMYRNYDMPVVDVAIPDQEIQNNVVTFVAVEGRVGKISQKGGNWTSEKQIQETFASHGVKSGDHLKQSHVQAALDELNSTGFRRADVVLKQGENRGESDVIASVQDRFPVRVYTGWDNTGSESLDTERWFAGCNWSEPLGLPHLFSYQFRAAPTANRYWTHSASYQMWLPWWKNRFLLYGTWAENNPQLDAAAFSLTGESKLLGAVYTVPFNDIISDDRKWTLEHSAFVGADYKNSNSDLSFTGVQVFNQSVDVVQFSLGYNAKLVDALGYTQVSPKVVYSPSGILENNDREAFVVQRSGADPEYAIFSVQWERSVNLPYQFEFNTSGFYQRPNKNLVGTEQIGLGGSSTIRGFPERTVSGDEGYYFRNELRAPALNPTYLAGFTSNRLDKLIFYGFFDYGELGPHQVDAANTIIDHQMSSAGAGMRYNLSSYLSMELSYGFRLSKPNITGDLDDHSLSYSFILAY